MGIREWIQELFGKNLEKEKEFIVRKIQRYADRFENAGEGEKKEQAYEAIDRIRMANTAMEAKEIEKEFYFKAGIHPLPREHGPVSNKSYDNYQEVGDIEDDSFSDNS